MGVLKNVWSVKEVVEIRELSGNMYAISFVDKQSMKMALEGGPWSVIGSCLNLKKWEIDQAIHDISFSKVIFWIQIHKLPLELMTLECKKDWAGFGGAHKGGRSSKEERSRKKLFKGKGGSGCRKAFGSRILGFERG